MNAPVPTPHGSVCEAIEYWRFYVRSVSHEQFVRTVGSWHPRKRALLDERSPSPSIVRRAR